MCCHPPRLGRSMVFVQMENIHRAVGMSGTPLFTGGGAMYAASCVSICMSHVMALAPQSVTHYGTCPLACVSHHCPQQGVPNCLRARGEQRRKTARTLHNITILRIRAHFMLWEQFIRPSLKAMRTLVIRPLQGYGNTASLSYPDTWVRKPDCLHLP